MFKIEELSRPLDTDLWCWSHLLLAEAPRPRLLRGHSHSWSRSWSLVTSGGTHLKQRTLSTEQWAAAAHKQLLPASHHHTPLPSHCRDVTRRSPSFPAAVWCWVMLGWELGRAVRSCHDCLLLCRARCNSGTWTPPHSLLAPPLLLPGGATDPIREGIQKLSSAHGSVVMLVMMPGLCYAISFPL